MEETTMEKIGPLDKFIVGNVSTVFYIPEYISAAEEEQLLKNIYQAPASKWRSLKNRKLQNWGGIVHEKGLLPQDLPPWLKNLTNRIYDESSLFPSAINHVLINEYLPDQGIMPHQDGPAYSPVVAILSLGSPVVMDFAPHHSFSNASDTSGNHNEDIASQLASMQQNSDERSSVYVYGPFSVALKPRSLLIFKDKAYTDYLHGIKDCQHQRFDEAVNVRDCLESDGQAKAADVGAEDGTVFHRTGTRVSLTCRVVTKVRKNIIKL